MPSCNTYRLAWVSLTLDEEYLLTAATLGSSSRPLPCPITSCQIDVETVETVSDFIFGAPKSLQMVIAAMKLKDAYSLEGKL